MKLRVLGCHGGELPHHRTTCFLFDEAFALDAGALTSQLSLARLVKLDHVVISHSHFDHIKDLPLLVDLLVNRRDRPLTVHASPACARALRTRLFANELWPDFTRIPDRRHPVLKIEPFELNEPFAIGQYRLLPVPVSHPVESCGFVISDGTSSLGFSGDTGPTEAIWRAFRAARSLKAVLVETSFPNRLQSLADVSGHLTPQTVGDQLRKARLKPSCKVLHYHLKPAFVGALKDELSSLKLGSRVAELDERIEL